MKPATNGWTSKSLILKAREAKTPERGKYTATARTVPHVTTPRLRRSTADVSTSSVAGVYHVAYFLLMRESGGSILRHTGVF